MFVPVFLLSFLATAYGTCDNACSGHGTCGLNGVCTCYDNWGLGLSMESGDCSERICPFEFSWVDTPSSTGKHHKYSECASKGICNRGTGECECFEGYEGKACQRTTCPNDCSGHGVCAYIEDMGYGTVPADYSATDDYTAGLKTFDYFSWDKMKTRGCVCDAQYGDVDCSKRVCAHGNDVMDHRQNMGAVRLFQKQEIVFNPANDDLTGLNGQTFALTFKSKLNETFTTAPIVFNSATGTAETAVMLAAIKSSLRQLPNFVIDDLSVVGAVSGNVYTATVEFTGDANQGDQNFLMVEPVQCLDGCTPKLTGLELKPDTQIVKTMTGNNAHFNSYECGRRGKCDYDTGLCECFEGYTSLACTTITALI